MSVGIDKQSMEIFQRNLRTFARRWPENVKRALRQVGETIMTDSKANYCPVDQGPLRASGHVEQDSKGVVIMSYDKEYAAIQHENESYHHPVGESGYLIKPLNRALPTILQDIASKAPIDRGTL